MEQLGPRIEGVETSVNEIKETVERMATNHSGNQNVTHVKLDGGRGLVTTMILGLACGVCLGVAVMAAAWVLSMKLEQVAMNNWTAQEVAAIRSYITTGKLAPMKPRPVDEPQPEKPQ